MPELLQEYWIFILVALIIGVIVAWWVFHASRRTRVQLEEKPAEGTVARRNQVLMDARPVATDTTVAGPVDSPPPIPSAPTPAPATGEGGDDLNRIKGVGPKLVALLNDQGVTSFAQIAGWDDAEIDRIDAQLGRFAGRIRRDNWVEQARFLAANDLTGYEGRFGKV